MLIESSARKREKAPFVPGGVYEKGGEYYVLLTDADGGYVVANLSTSTVVDFNGFNYAVASEIDEWLNDAKHVPHAKLVIPSDSVD